MGDAVTLTRTVMAGVVNMVAPCTTAPRTMVLTFVLDNFSESQFAPVLERVEEGGTSTCGGWKQSMTWILLAGAHVTSTISPEGVFHTRTHGHGGTFQGIELAWPCSPHPIRVTGFSHAWSAPSVHRVKDRVDEKDVVEVVLRHSRTFAYGPGVQVIMRLSWRGKTATQCYSALQCGAEPERSVCIKISPDTMSSHAKSNRIKDDAKTLALDALLKIATLLGMELLPSPAPAMHITCSHSEKPLTPADAYSR